MKYNRYPRDKVDYKMLLFAIIIDAIPFLRKHFSFAEPQNDTE